MTTSQDMRRWISSMLESDQSDIIKLTSAAQQHFGEGNLYGGNCGMFALALGKILTDQNKPCEIAIVHQDSPHQEDITTDDILQQELMVYHAAVSYQGRLYDGDGEVSQDNIADWVEKEYGDYHAQISTYPVTDPLLSAVMRNETKWTISADEFYEFFKKQIT
jgi:hypothetical protein